ncbi:MAG: hypothetical protein WDN08_18115 [Rhizomicrobium sp.]
MRDFGIAGGPELLGLMMLVGDDTVITFDPRRSVFFKSPTRAFS